MKFDHIIMNPPYCRNLHLKILSESVKHSDDIVNLSPIRWLQDPLAEYKKSSDYIRYKSVADHIDSIDVLKARDVSSLFDAGFHSDLGIYHVTDVGGFSKCEIEFESDTARSAFFKIWNKCKDNKLKDNFSSDKKFKINLPHIHGHIGSSDFWESTSKRFDIAMNTKSSSELSFKTEAELKNFYDSLFLNVYCFFNTYAKIGVHTNINAPYLNDYTKKWTNAELYKYFELTEREIEEIENTVARYK